MLSDFVHSIRQTCPEQFPCAQAYLVSGILHLFAHCEHCTCGLCPNAHAVRPTDQLVVDVEAEQRSISGGGSQRLGSDEEDIEDAELFESELQSSDCEKEDIQPEFLASSTDLDRFGEASRFNAELSTPSREVYTWIPKDGCVINSIRKRSEEFTSTECNKKAKGCEPPVVSFGMYAYPCPSKFNSRS